MQEKKSFFLDSVVSAQMESIKANTQSASHHFCRYGTLEWMGLQ